MDSSLSRCALHASLALSLGMTVHGISVAQSCQFTGLDANPGAPACLDPALGRTPAAVCPVVSLDRRIAWEPADLRLDLQAYQHGNVTGLRQGAASGTVTLRDLTNGLGGETELKLWSGPCADATVDAFDSFTDDFEKTLAWGKYEEIPNNNTACYTDGVGQVTLDSSAAFRGLESILVWANAGQSTKSNHLLGNLELADQGRPGRWQYTVRAYIPPESAGTCQTGPEFSVQNTRMTGGASRTTIGGIQYRANPYLQGSDLHSWAVWAEIAPGNADWVVFANQSLAAGAWYSLTLSVDFDLNQYISLSIRGPDVYQQFDLSKYKIAQENRGYAEAFWLTVESENLWSCGNPAVYQCKMLYDDVGLAPFGGPIVDATVGAASYLPSVSSNGWASVFGLNLGSAARAWQASDIVAGKLPTRLEGAEVTIDGQPAAIGYSSPAQLNAEVPNGVALGERDIEVATDAGRVVESAQVQRCTPSFFVGPASLNPPRNYVAAVASVPDSDGVIRYIGQPELLPGVPARPARPADLISLYGTGFGPTNPPGQTGWLVTTAYPLANGVTLTIGGSPAPVSYAGLTMTGLDQLNIQVPDLPDGDYVVTASVCGGVAQPGIYLTVQR
jgi:uncharacterized protein (TIGR03437 family)